MPSKYRCPGCLERHPAPGPHRLGLNQVCSTDCLEVARDRANEKAKKAKKAPSHRVTSGPDVPPLVRVDVLQRDRGRCRFCGTAADIHLHHINYRSEGVDHQAHNLISLCTTHHDLIHSSKRRWKPVLLAYIWLVYTEDKRYLIPLLERQLKKEGLVL